MRKLVLLKNEIVVYYYERKLQVNPVRKKVINRTLSLFLSIMIVLSIFPMAAFAVEDIDLAEEIGQESVITETTEPEDELPDATTENPVLEDEEVITSEEDLPDEVAVNPTSDF